MDAILIILREVFSRIYIVIKKTIEFSIFTVYFREKILNSYPAIPEKTMSS